MIRHKQLVTLFLVAIMVGGLSSIITCSMAQISKPSVPEFTVRFVNTPYDVPSAYVFDPFTGHNLTANIGGQGDKGILLTIKNQPFTPYLDPSSNNPVHLYYNVRARVYSMQNSTNDANWTVLFRPRYMPMQPDLENTTISLAFGGEDAYYGLDGRVFYAPEGSQIDFQVQALEGYVHRSLNPNYTNPSDMAPYVFTGEAGDWSSTQTITIPQALPSESPIASPISTSTPSPTESPSPEPTLTPTAIVPEFPAWIILPLAFSVMFVLAAILRKSRL